MSSKKAYIFGGEKSDGDTTIKNILGGKGSNLAEMTPGTRGHLNPPTRRADSMTGYAHTKGESFTHSRS